MIRKTARYLLLLILLLYAFVDAYIFYHQPDDDTARMIVYMKRKYSGISNDSIPANIIKAFETVYPGSATGKVYPDLFCILLMDRRECLPFLLAQQVFYKRKSDLLWAANHLDNALTKEQCTWGLLERTDFLNGARGIRKAAALYYNKQVKDLTETECLELAIMYQNPSLYSKYRHQDKLDEKRAEIIARQKPGPL